MAVITHREFSFVFPTLILQRHLNEAERDVAVHRSLRAIVLEREAAEPGVRYSNVGGWHSTSDLFEWPHPEVKTLRDTICAAVKDYVCMERRIAPRSLQLAVGLEGWANVTRVGNYARPHIHPNSNLSGVYYVDAGSPSAEHAESGLLEFLDPRQRPQLFQTAGTDTRDSYVVTPKTGLLILFPSWLYHYVHPYSGEGERISIAFNVVIQRLLRAPEEPHESGREIPSE